MDNKLSTLKNLIKSYPSAIVAFSGGVDSTFLAAVANQVLPGKLLLVTAQSSTYTRTELESSIQTAKLLGVPQEIIVSEELDIAGFSDNTPDRCYYCKRALFEQMLSIAKARGYAVVMDGSNTDDLRDYRPGRRAVQELSISSPLCESGLSKEDIRRLSSDMNLPTAAKPSMACLASRFPYGEKISREKLERVGNSEEKLRALGLKQFRIRSHDNLARIEVDLKELDYAWSRRQEMVQICKSVGFIYVSLDLQGYRTGAMNEVLV